MAEIIQFGKESEFKPAMDRLIDALNKGEVYNLAVVWSRKDEPHEPYTFWKASEGLMLMGSLVLLTRDIGEKFRQEDVVE